jgi:hypothetical protein
VHVPFYLGAATVAAAIGVLATGHSQLTRAERPAPEPAGAQALDRPEGAPAAPRPTLVTGGA